MELFLKGCSAVIIGLILSMIAGSGRKEFHLLVSLTVCVMVSICAMSYLRPVIAFIKQLQTLGNLNSEVLSILLKAVGIGVLTEVSVLVCNDAGNASFGKVLQYLGTSVILWMSIPLFQMMTDLLQRIMESV